AASLAANHDSSVRARRSSSNDNHPFIRESSVAGVVSCSKKIAPMACSGTVSYFSRRKRSDSISKYSRARASRRLALPSLTVPPQPGCPAGDPGVGLLTLLAEPSQLVGLG